MIHKSVLLKEVIEYLLPQPNENFVDCTLGAGGHSLAILGKTEPSGKLLGIDLSKEAIKDISLKTDTLNLGSRLILVNDNFVNLSEIIKNNNFYPVNGILLDLGLSSDLLEKSGRGFSFQKDEFLDMRFGDEGPTAYELINQLPPKALEKIFKEYGEEKFAGKIASGIARLHRQQKIKTTFDLKRAILESMGMPISEGASIKIFAKIFQALRIAVNNELENLEETLNQAMPVLAVGGRLVVISFHSLEDRLVKNFFRQAKQDGKIEILTKKPIGPDQEELRDNNRSRSAKLRAAIKI
jgi:16S rRNA (cytosine1402-N4)-methyltransferase